MERVYGFMEDLANNRNSELRSVIQGSEAGTTFSKKDLENRITGFRDLNRSEQAAVVGVIARLSIDFHMQQGVAASPHRREGNYPPYKWREIDHDQNEPDQPQHDENEQDGEHKPQQPQIEREALRERDVLRQQNWDGVESRTDSRAADIRQKAKTPFADVEPSGPSAVRPRGVRAVTWTMPTARPWRTRLRRTRAICGRTSPGGTTR